MRYAFVRARLLALAVAVLPCGIGGCSSSTPPVPTIDQIAKIELSVAQFHQVEMIRPDFLRWKLRLVMAGPSLFEAHVHALALGADNDGLQVEEILVITLVIDRFDTSQPLHESCQPAGDPRSAIGP